MRKIENAVMGQSWTCYAGAVYGALKSAGLWEEDLTSLMGEMGILFHFIMEKNTCPSGVTVYDWQGTHYEMLDRVGVSNELFIVHKEARFNTFEGAQKLAVRKITESIDRGVPAVVWAPTPILEFGLISGYDEIEKVLFPVDCVSSDPDPIQYANFGLSEVPIIHVQTFHEKFDYDRAKTLRNALSFGIAHWNSDTHVSANYGAGKNGWENLIAALESGNYNPFGLSYCMNVYAESKQRCAEFLGVYAEKLPGFDYLADSAQYYRETAEQTARMAKLLPFKGPQATSVAPADIPELIECARKGFDAEEKGMKILEENT